MTTYQKGHEPAGAPVTWERDKNYDSVYVVTLGYDAADCPSEIEVHDVCYADAICAAFHAAVEWRKLAEEARGYVSDYSMSVYGKNWLARFDAMKETFGE